MHRLEACKALGWHIIPATVVATDTLRNELAELDENLVRRQLTALQEADALARRKELYEAIHPQTKRGVAGASARWEGRENASEENSLASPTPSFAASTAQVLGVTERTVQIDVQIANNLGEEARAVVEGTQVEGTQVEGKKVQLLKVVQFPREQQVVA